VNILNKILILLITLSIFSCKKIEETPVIDSRPTIDSFRIALSPYVKDQSINFFLENSWYAYDEGNHIIWPNFRVYVLRIDSQYFKFQVVDYYDEISRPGNFTIRVQPEGEESYLLDFKAEGCGNVYTNPAYKECIKNPETNVYSYIDLNTKSVSKLTKKEAKNNADWDIAFNGTDIKLNSGKNGLGSVRAANLYVYGGFFSGDKINFQRIAEESFGQRGIRFFNQNFNYRKAAFSIPEGQTRAIFENDWFTQNRSTSFFEAISKNWWIVKGQEANTYSKINIKEISEEQVGEHIESKITLSLFNQSETQTEFGPEETWELPTFSTAKRLIKICLDLNKKEVVPCNNPKADLRLSMSNKTKRRWRINVLGGAVGPLSKSEMQNWVRGN
tara:strand:- start:142783 stop:143946 length:1164 start_codon:yes stop_codon:yes gene_type:complete